MSAVPNRQPIPQSTSSSDRSVVSPKGPRRGRSRDQQSREAIYEATRKLAHIAPRYRELSIERIAAEANASKATIYRWWDSKADLIREACLVNRIEPAPGVSLREDLAHIVR